MRLLRDAGRIALRELRGGPRGFYVFLASLALGVAAIAGAGAVGESLKQGLGGELRVILGGDAQLRLNRALASEDDLAWLESQGRVSHVLDANAMAEANDRRRLVRLRGVDAAYPLYGALELSGGATRDVALAGAGDVWGAAAKQEVLDTFQVDVGDRLALGGLEIEIRALIDKEPDDIDVGFDFAPRLLVDRAALDAAGLVRDGAFFTARYRVALPGGVEAEAWSEEAEARFDDPAHRVTTREELGGQLNDLVDQLTTFLAIAGLATLLAGGLGVAQATGAFLDTRVESIAILKTVGASQNLVRAAYLIQILVLALLGSLLGAAVGAAAPSVLIAAAGDALPLPANPGFYPAPLIKAVVFGLVAAAAFALPAIGRARATPPAALFGGAGRVQARTPWLERGLALAAAAVFVALAVGWSAERLTTAVLLGGSVAAFLALLGVARLVMWIARRGAKGARGLPRLALNGLGGPGSVAPVAAPALGLGLTLLGVVALVQSNLVVQLKDTAPSNAPSLVFNQIPDADVAKFDAAVAGAGIDLDDPDAFRRMAIFLGRLRSVNGAPIDVDEVERGERWIVSGEVGMTVLAEASDDIVIAAGDWWEADPAEPQVSIEADAARGVGLEIGDLVGFRVFGRDVEARLTNTRDVEWGGFGANFAVIFSPGVLDGANPRHTAIVRADPENEDAVAEAVGAASPDTLIFRVRERLQAAAEVFDKATRAIDAVAGVVIAAGALVMFGAFAAAARRRAPEAALLKTLGVTPSGVLWLYAGEFALTGVLAAALAAVFATVAAYPIVVRVFEAAWAPQWDALAGSGAIAVLAAAVGGALVARAALARPPLRVLRAD